MIRHPIPSAPSSASYVQWEVGDRVRRVFFDRDQTGEVVGVLTAETPKSVLAHYFDTYIVQWDGQADNSYGYGITYTWWGLEREPSDAR